MKIENIPNINYLWAGLIIEELVRNGADHFCIAPGSRSTPLTISAAECAKGEKTVHFDERGLGFFALGVSSSGKGPAVLISTSGTAVANFFPAVIEASKKKVPLIILTADRPPELRKTGALQTIDQPGIFGKYVKWDFDLPVPDPGIKPESVLTTIDQAIFMAKSGTPGPVHINCMFREPLTPEESGGEWRNGLEPVKKWIQSGDPYTKYTGSEESFTPGSLKEITEIIGQSKKGIIVAGKLKDNEGKSVIELAEKLKWPIFPDLTSGLRLDSSSDHIIHYFDQVLLSDFSNGEKIDTIIHLGGRITSKRYYQFIEKVNPDNYITVLNHPLRNDPLHIVSHRVRSSVAGFVDAVLPEMLPGDDDELVVELRNASDITEGIIENFVNEGEKLNEIFISREISNMVKDGNAMFLSNSMPIRDMDMYAVSNGKTLHISGNRGASGIDGVIASACGYSSSINAPLTLLIGDIAFLHDMNSLALVRESKKQIIIVLINNGGGSIFSFLPVAEYKTTFEKYFLTPHGLNFDHAADQFNIKYSKVTTKKEFSDEYRSAVQGSESVILEAVVDMDENLNAHKELQSLIKIKLDKKQNN